MFCVPGFFKVLAELTQTGDVTAEQFLSQSHCTRIFKTVSYILLNELAPSYLYLVCWHPEKFEHMKKTGDYYIIVVEDTNLGQIVATATLITEHKYIHACAKVNPTVI